MSYIVADFRNDTLSLRPKHNGCDLTDIIRVTNTISTTKGVSSAGGVLDEYQYDCRLYAISIISFIGVREKAGER